MRTLPGYPVLHCMFCIACSRPAIVGRGAVALPVVLAHLPRVFASFRVDAERPRAPAHAAVSSAESTAPAPRRDSLPVCFLDDFADGCRTFRRAEGASRAIRGRARYSERKPAVRPTPGSPLSAQRESAPYPLPREPGRGRPAITLTHHLRHPSPYPVVWGVDGRVGKPYVLGRSWPWVCGMPIVFMGREMLADVGSDGDQGSSGLPSHQAAGPGVPRFVVKSCAFER